MDELIIPGNIWNSEYYSLEEKVVASIFATNEGVFTIEDLVKLTYLPRGKVIRALQSLLATDLIRKKKTIVNGVKVRNAYIHFTQDEEFMKEIRGIK